MAEKIACGSFLSLRNKKTYLNGLVSRRCRGNRNGWPKKQPAALFYRSAIKKLILMASFLAAVAATETDGRKNSLRFAAALFYRSAIKKLILTASFLAAAAATETHGPKKQLVLTAPAKGLTPWSKNSLAAAISELLKNGGPPRERRSRRPLPRFYPLPVKLIPPSRSCRAGRGGRRSWNPETAAASPPRR